MSWDVHCRYRDVTEPRLEARTGVDVFTERTPPPPSPDGEGGGGVYIS